MCHQKKSTFSFHQSDTLPKLIAHELVILVEFQRNQVKIEEFLQIVLFFIAHTLVR